MANTFKIQAWLNKTRKYERKALQILKNLQAEGYETRYILTAALLALEEIQLPAPGQTTETEMLRSLIEELQGMLESGVVPSKPASLPEQGRVKMSRAMLDFVVHGAFEEDDEDD